MAHIAKNVVIAVASFVSCSPSGISKPERILVLPDRALFALI
jgi:hypothetical protein